MIINIVSTIGTMETIGIVSMVNMVGICINWIIKNKSIFINSIMKKIELLKIVKIISIFISIIIKFTFQIL